MHEKESIPIYDVEASLGDRPARGIETTPGICGGSARIAGTRIPVWTLVEARALGASESQILLDFPSLKPSDLGEAWRYAERHRDEVESDIHQNETA